MMAAALDHLWQSTLVALAVALLILAFRRASAAVRYGLWFAASVKFLVPFAALAALGKLLAPSFVVSWGLFPARAAPEAVFIEKAAQPFSQTSLAQFPFAHSPLLQVPFAPSHATAPAVHVAPQLDLALILAAVWVLGSVAVLARWAGRWASVRAAVRSATRLDWPAPMPVLASPSLMEPGLVGLWRPVLVLPQSLPGHLTQVEISAIVAHEAAHLRRRDNVTAAIHMLVEALFWFHPLVWWIGARLIEERERACDEAVVRSGHDRAAYARSLVESCRLYLQSPLDCVAGASGSNLKTRVETIMTAPLSSPLTSFKKALLLAAGSLAFATPVAAGLLSSPEGQKAVAHAVAVASNAAHVRAFAMSTDPTLPAQPESSAAKSISLAQDTAVLAPAIAIASNDAASVALARDAAAPLPATLGALAAAPADAKTQAAAAFVQSFAPTLWNDDPICVRVEGLQPDKAAYVQARVTSVARAAGLSVSRAGCQFFYQVEIRFAADAERAVRDVDGYKFRNWSFPIERPTGANRPIQAWYELAYDLAGVPLRDRIQGDSAREDHKKLGLAIVVVDPARTRDMSLDVVSDYVAMLALSQPRALDRCNVLPSVTDLFAGACPGRGAPTGLTAADVAYLKALYTGNPELRAARYPSELVGRVAELLAAGSPSTRSEAAPPAPIRTVQPAPAPSAAASAAASARPVAARAPLATNPADAKKVASSFVQSYAAATRFHTIGRWTAPLCINVVGLEPQQEAAVRARVAEMAEAVGVSVLDAPCRGNLEIGFTNDPQGMLDGVKGSKAQLLGDRTSETRDVKTDTLPVQAWYVTNGELYAAADTDRLKVPVLWQSNVPGPDGREAPGTAQPGATSSNNMGMAEPPFPGAPAIYGARSARQFLNVFVIVDLRKTGNKPLGVITDYVAMLALSQPRSLGQCNALPSVTDLFADCPGRPAPDGVTQADAAYLTALYTASGAAVGQSHQSHVVQRMADLLVNPKMASR